MKDAPPPLFNRAIRKARSLAMRPKLKAYLEGMDSENPLRGLPARVVGDASADPTEFFNHYDGFAFWVANRLAQRGVPRRILDIGSPKMQNAMLSASHDVTAVVLADADDRFSRVKYVYHDVTERLPFDDAVFDCFTSTVAIPLIGLGRYGDRVDPNAIPNLIIELGRVMTDAAELLVSLTLGPNMLAFNNSWYLDLETTKRLFAGWTLVETVIDQWSSPRMKNEGDPADRFIGPERMPNISQADYRVMFCAFIREGRS